MENNSWDILGAIADEIERTTGLLLNLLKITYLHRVLQFCIEPICETIEYNPLQYCLVFS